MQTSASSSAQGNGAVLGVMLPHTCTEEIWTIVTLTLVTKGTRSANTRVAARSNNAFQAFAQRYPSAQPLAWPRALTHGLACSHAQRRAARARVAPAPQRPRHSIALGTPAPSTALGADAREPTQWPHAGDRYRATHRALPARLPSYADYILRLQDIENPGASRSMLRLLLVALPLVVALLAAFDEHEVDALQLVVRSPLQFQVRSPPKSRPLRPQPPRELNTIAQPQHTPLRSHTTRQAHTSQWTRHGTRMRARRSTPRSTSSPTNIHRCAPQPGRPPRMRRSFGRPCRCARKAAAHAAGARARGRARAMSAPAPARLRRLRARREARRHLRWPSALASAPPRLFC